MKTERISGKLRVLFDEIITKFDRNFGIILRTYDNNSI